MMVKLSFLAAASFAAFTVSQMHTNKPATRNQNSAANTPGACKSNMSMSSIFLNDILISFCFTCMLNFVTISMDSEINVSNFQQQQSEKEEENEHANSNAEVLSLSPSLSLTLSNH